MSLPRTFLRRMDPLLRILFGFAIAAMCLGVSLLTDAELYGKVASEPAAPLIAIGDVHGDFDDFCAILKHAGLVDEQLHWHGGRATLVQTGDMLDRGPKSRQALDLLASLESESAQAGGRVVALIGNHEMMGLMGDLRYVSPQDYASFSDAQSEDLRKKSYKQYASWRDAHQSLLADIQDPVFEASESDWMAKHPAGFVEQRAAFAPGGHYGKWIRGHQAVAKVNDVLFAHGGITTALTSQTVDQINATVHSEIAGLDQAREYLESQKVILPFFTWPQIVAVLKAEILATKRPNPPPLQWPKLETLLAFSKWLSVREDGPLWYRAYDQWPEDQGQPLAQQILDAYRAKRIVVAHTVQRSSRIRARFGGRLFLIDTGMLASFYPGGRASALEIYDDGKVVADYMDGQEVLSPAGNAGAGPGSP